MVNAFVIASGHLIWTVDNRREDEAVGWIQDERHGTRVRCEIDANTEVTLNEVFDSISDPEKPGVNRTTIRVSLFQDGGGFISRTEAKRIGARLESYGTVELDFEGIESVGQGFVDELFRVWQADHPQTRLVPVRANPSIISMIGMSDPDAIRRSQ